MKSLFNEGLRVYPPELPHAITCKAILLTGTCDMPAKATALNMISHNGFYACPYCEQPGRTVAVGKRHGHILPAILMVQKEATHLFYVVQNKA